MSRTTVISFLTALTGSFAIYGILVDSPFTWIYVAITFVLGVAVWLIDRLVQLPVRALWALVAAAFSNLLGGVFLVDGQPLYVYELIGTMAFDKPAHFFATGMATFAAYEALRGRLDGGPLGLAFAAITMGMGVGAVVEIVEFIANETMENVNVGGYTNNMLDLIANAAGAVVAGLVATRLAPADQ